MESDASTERPSLYASDMNNVRGLEIGFEIKFEQKGEKCLKRERLENACQNWLAFSRQLSREFSVCVSSLLSLLVL